MKEIAFAVWACGALGMPLFFDLGYEKSAAKFVVCAAWPVWLAVIVLESILEQLEGRP